MDLHHQPDQSYRIPRRAQARRVLALTQPLLATGRLLPARTVEAPDTLVQDTTILPSSIRIVQDYSQPTAMVCPGKVGVLIFGSSTKPGGGWLNGAKAQEEDISLSSTWGSQAALAPPGFYGSRHGLGSLGPDKALMAQGYWLLDPNGHPLDPPQPAVFASVAAPNLANDQVANLSRIKRIDHLARRLVAAFTGWHTAGVDHAVLGAIGCGVFRWPPEDSAQALRLALQHLLGTGHSLPSIVLALPDPHMSEVFARILDASAVPDHANPAIRPSGKRQ